MEHSGDDGPRNVTSSLKDDRPSTTMIFLAQYDPSSTGHNMILLAQYDLSSTV